MGFERFISLPPSFLCLLPVCGWDVVSRLPTPQAFCLTFITAMDSSKNKRPWVVFAYGVYHSNMGAIPISILASLAAGNRARHSRRQHVLKTNSLLFPQVSWWIIIPKLDKIQLVWKGMLGIRQVFHLKFQSKPKVEPPWKTSGFYNRKAHKMATVICIFMVYRQEVFKLTWERSKINSWVSLLTHQDTYALKRLMLETTLPFP